MKEILITAAREIKLKDSTISSYQKETFHIPHCISTGGSVRPSVHQSVYLSVRPSVHLSVRPSIRPSVTLYFFWVFAVFGFTAPAQMIW